MQRAEGWAEPARAGSEAAPPRSTARGETALVRPAPVLI